MNRKEIKDYVYSEWIRRSILCMGRTAPNPSVAAVLYSLDPPLIFSGGTEKPGNRHAEIVALDQLDSYTSLNTGKVAGKWLMDVTLEPCSKTGRTPPCARRIIEYPGIESVVVGIPDPSLSGEGVAMILESGKSVDLADQSSGEDLRTIIARAFLAGFDNRIKGKGPRYHLKAASSVDNFMGRKDYRVAISKSHARTFTMILRSRLDAVVVGPGTIQTDLPSLNLRFPIDTEEQAESLVDSYREGIDNFGNSIQIKRTGSFFSEDSSDVFTGAIFANKKEILHQMHFYREEFEPDRVFLMGRPFEGQNEFLLKQEELTEITGKGPVYLCFSSTEEYWKDRIPLVKVLPDMDSNVFPRYFREAMGELGYNEIMIEGGAALFESLSPDLNALDRLYLIKSKDQNLACPEEVGVRLPPMFENGDILTDVDLGEDMLYVRSASPVQD